MGKQQPYTLVDGFKVYHQIPNDGILSQFGLPVLCAYAEHHGITPTTDREQLREALRRKRDTGVVAWEDSNEPVLPPEVEAAYTEAIGAPVGPLTARKGQVIRGKPKGSKAPPRPLEVPAPTSFEEPLIPVAEPAPSAEPLVAALWRQGKARLHSLLQVRWTADKAVQYCKDHRVEALPKDLVHFICSLQSACALHGMRTQIEEGPVKVVAPPSVEVAPAPVAPPRPRPVPTSATAKPTPAKRVSKPGVEQDYDKPWDSKKVTLFKALSSLGAVDPLSSVSTPEVVAYCKGALTPRDVRHYAYHAKAGGLVEVVQGAKETRGYSFYLTAAGQRLDPDHELAAGH